MIIVTSSICNLALNEWNYNFLNYNYNQCFCNESFVSSPDSESDKKFCVDDHDWYSNGHE